MTSDELKPIVDALIFASESPISLQKIKQILDDDREQEVPQKDIREAVEELNRDNRERQRGFFMQEVAGGYQYRTRPNYAPWVKKLRKTKPFRLTQSTLETLAIIAYKQPLTRADIDKIRGVDTGGVIKNLLERGLIKIVGRKNIPGRPFLLSTTKRFLEVFGLEKLADLPSLKEFESLDEARLPTILRDSADEALFEINDDGEAPDDRIITDDDLACHAGAGETIEGQDADTAPGTDGAAAGPADPDFPEAPDITGLQNEDNRSA